MDERADNEVGLDVNRLRMFREAARCGSFGAAAERLGFTRSAVSQQIAALERESGTFLFERGTRGVRLTEAGRVLLPHAERTLGGLLHARADLAAVARGETGRLLLGSFPTATASFFAETLATFRARFPAVGLDVIDNEPYEIVRRLEHRELDCALLFEIDHWPITSNYEGQTVSSGEGVTYEPLFDDPFVLAMPANHRLSSYDRVPLRELHNEAILGSPTETAPWSVALTRACRRAGFAPRYEPRYRTAVDFHTVQALVATGWGLSLIPALALNFVRPAVCIRPLEGAPVRHVKLAFPPVKYRSAACSAMVELVRESVSRLSIGGAVADAEHGDGPRKVDEA